MILDFRKKNWDTKNSKKFSIVIKISKELFDQNLDWKV